MDDLLLLLLSLFLMDLLLLFYQQNKMLNQQQSCRQQITNEHTTEQADTMPHKRLLDWPKLQRFVVVLKLWERRETVFGVIRFALNVTFIDLTL